jgi:hypothetical protein
MFWILLGNFRKNWMIDWGFLWHSGNGPHRRGGRMRRRALLYYLTAAVAGLATVSCGYHVAGKGAALPPTIKTIAVPAFKNESSQFRIEQMVPAAITRELIERTHYRVTAKPAGADAEIEGTIQNVTVSVLTFDPQTGAATTLQIEVTASVDLLDLHTHKTLYANPRYLFRQVYQVSPNTQTLFEEVQPALQRLSRDFAQTLVTDILENF